jgi:hypothetical protein
MKIRMLFIRFTYLWYVKGKFSKAVASNFTFQSCRAGKQIYIEIQARQFE